jgi:hypothetical protein
VNDQLIRFSEFLAEEAAWPIEPPTHRWHVQLSSGNWSMSFEVTQPTIFSAIERAFLEAEESDGQWPWCAADIEVKVRRMK